MSLALITHKSNIELDVELGLYYYGARYYNPQSSVWLSVDPLAEKYPAWSSYNFVLGNPIKFVDPDGREVEYGGANRAERRQIKRDVRAAKRSDNGFKQDFKVLKKSEETYVFNGVDGDGGGNTTTKDGQKVMINYSFNSQNNDLGTGKLTSLIHEAEHAVQFENGEIGFRKVSDGNWTAINYDITDELKAYQAASNSKGSVHTRNGTNTFQGDMQNIATGISDPKTLSEKRNILLGYYGNQPEYHAKLQGYVKDPLNNIQIKKRIQNGKFFMRPYIR